MFKTLALAAVSTVVLASGALADEYAKYGAENGWTIWANKSSGGCFLENRNNNGNTVQMGLRNAGDTLGFMGLWNHSASIMEPGEVRDMKLDIDGSPYTFRAAANDGPVSNGMTGGYMYFNNPDFVAGLENGKVLTIMATGDLSVQIDLTGTKKGIAMARECVASQSN